MLGISSTNIWKASPSITIMLLSHGAPCLSCFQKLETTAQSKSLHGLHDDLRHKLLEHLGKTNPKPTDAAGSHRILRMSRWAFRTAPVPPLSAPWHLRGTVSRTASAPSGTVSHGAPRRCRAADGSGRWVTASWALWPMLSVGKIRCWGDWGAFWATSVFGPELKRVVLVEEGVCFAVAPS